MLSSTLAAVAALLPNAVSAVPAFQDVRTRQATTASVRLGLKWLGPSNSTLPKILVLYTGGTIAAGSAFGALDDSLYGQLAITGEQIIARDPYLLNHTQLAVANWRTNDYTTGTSDSMVMNMTRFAHDALCSKDSDIVGAVFTHGTNSLEETAFLMDNLINCGKPIVGVGAMRPFTHLSYDGDSNFFDAVVLAASPESRDRGLMVAFNSRIIPGYWVTKLHSTNPDAFGASAGGDLGLFINGSPIFFNTPSQPLFKHPFDLAKVSAYSYPTLPKVDILYAAREFDGKLVLNAQANGAKGVVIAGTGNGAVPSGEADVKKAIQGGLQVVVGTRSPFGVSSPEIRPLWAKSGFVHVIQARILLQLAIASGMSMDQTIDMFEGGFRKAMGLPTVKLGA